MADLTGLEVNFHTLCFVGVKYLLSIHILACKIQVMIFPKIYILFLTDLADLFIVKKLHYSVILPLLSTRTIQSIAFPGGGMGVGGVSRCQNNMPGQCLSVSFFS